MAFDSAVADESGGNLKTPQSEFLSEGEFAVVDQGKELIAGYVNDRTRLCRSTLPVIVFGDHTRCIKYVDFPFCMGADGIKVLRPRVEADVKYLFHFLRQIRLHDGGYDRHFKYLKRTDVILPPLGEQRRIAEVLDRAEALRAKRRAALVQLDALNQSLFLDLFGDPAANPKGWSIRQLTGICSIDAPLVDPTREEFRKLLHYGPDRIERDTGGLLPAKTIEEDGQTSVKFLFEENAILYSKIRPNLNKVALTTGRGLCSADVYPVTVNSGMLTREFLWCLLRSPHFLSYAAEFSNRANIPKINREQFLGYPAICPPLALQREFARRVAAVERLKTSQRAALAELDALFASLQHRAFRGEL